ncbi:MAG: hypothetical protein IKA17_03420 [Clostridia bacterium]|nr:hypothetical protein [Clostridia bacterium]
MKYNFAVIDLGSNSVRMTINSADENGEWEVLEKIRDTVRLSENMGSDMILKKASIDRVIDALKRFYTIAEKYNCTKIKAVATAAVRYARNKEEFLSRAKNEANIEFQVISGEDEAYYSYLAIKSTVGIDDGVLMDTGGGSTEITLVKNGALVNSISLPLGAVVMTENVEEENLKEYVKEKLSEIPWLSECENLPLYAIGGSARTAGMLAMKRHLSSAEIEGLRIKNSAFEEMYENVYLTPKDKRKDIAGMDVSRADIILAGITPAKIFMGLNNTPEIIICLSGVKEGVFFEIKDEITKSRRNIK